MLVLLLRSRQNQRSIFFDVFRKEIEMGMVSVESICKWCILHHIQYGIKFKYYKYPRNAICKNIKYLIEYIGMKNNLDKIRKGGLTD